MFIFLWVYWNTYNRAVGKNMLYYFEYEYFMLIEQ